MTDARRSSAAIWRWPLALALLTVAGLFFALIGQEGLWLPLSWLFLSLPLALIAYYWFVRQRA